MSTIASVRINTSQGFVLFRDWFAGQALAGHYANWGEKSGNEIARLSYMMADAMISARSRPEEDNG